MSYVAVGAEPTPVRVVPPPPPPPSPWAERAGYQREGDAQPVYRWEPPVAFNDPVFSRSRAWGRSRLGPAYRGSASRECPECLQGLGAYYAARQNWPIPLTGLGWTPGCDTPGRRLGQRGLVPRQGRNRVAGLGSVTQVLPYVGMAVAVGVGLVYLRKRKQRRG